MHASSAEKLGVIEASYASAIIGVFLAPCRLIVNRSWAFTATSVPEPAIGPTTERTSTV